MKKRVRSKNLNQINIYGRAVDKQRQKILLQQQKQQLRRWTASRIKKRIDENGPSSKATTKEEPQGQGLNDISKKCISFGLWLTYKWSENYKKSDDLQIRIIELFFNFLRQHRQRQR